MLFVLSVFVCSAVIKMDHAVVHGVVVTKESQGWRIEKNNKNSKNQKNHNVTLGIAHETYCV